jgi:hypothetical protein
MPKPLEDVALGRFTWDEENGFWLGTVAVPPHDPAWLTLQVGPSEGQAALSLAREAVGRLRDLEPEARRFLAAELRKSRPPEAAAGGPEGIEGAVGRLALKSVNAEPDGVLELVFGNEEVFGAVEFFVWDDGAGQRGIIVMDESRLSSEGGTA